MGGSAYSAHAFRAAHPRGRSRVTGIGAPMAHTLVHRRSPASLGDRDGLVAKVRDQTVVVGYLVLSRCADAEQRAADRMSHAMTPRPGGKDVVEAPGRVQADGGEGIAVGPGVAGRAVAGHFPAVIEHQAGTGGGGAACEHPDLV